MPKHYKFSDPNLLLECDANGNPIKLLSSPGKSVFLKNSKTPSIFSGGKTATTNTAGQAELFATGATYLDAAHINESYDLIIGFGNTLAEAIDALTNGEPGVDKFLLLRTGLAGVPVTMHQHIGDYAAYAWLGVGGTVNWLSTQGV